VTVSKLVVVGDVALSATSVSLAEMVEVMDGTDVVIELGTLVGEATFETVVVARPSTTIRASVGTNVRDGTSVVVDVWTLTIDGNADIVVEKETGSRTSTNTEV